MSETWKVVENFEGLYEVSNIGRIRSKKRQGSQGGVLVNTPNGTGYYMMRFQDRSRGLYVAELVHRVVAKAFIPNPENKPQVNHINSIRTDNRVENLEWVTNLENVRHSQAAGRFNHLGENNNSAKLTEKQVVEIKLLIKEGNFKDRYIGEIYGVSRENIRDIRLGKLWKHVSLPLQQ